MTDTLHFPTGFLWGTASAPYQVEGNNTNSQWWEFEQHPGAIWHGDRSGLACDWWRHGEQDFDRMQQIHQNAHRLGLEWSRIEPQQGRFDPAAVGRYRQMLSALRERGMEPLATLHHFSDPLWFASQGGWEHADSIFLFRRYVDHVVRELGDLCTFWVTINEPVAYAVQGWLRGVFPPGKTQFRQTLTVTRHLLMAHGHAYQTLHSRQPQARVGYAKHVRIFRPLRISHPLDRLVTGLRRYLFEHMWVKATVDGRIRPPMGIGHTFAPLKASFDFMGINYYTEDQVRFRPNAATLFGQEEFLPGSELSDAGRHGPFICLAPEGIYQACQEMSGYGRPIFITENGVPDRNDTRRPQWLLAHLHQIHRALKDGIPIQGYFHWTLVDNFEWAEGWGLRFGLFEMNPVTQEKHPRPSAHLYGAIARHNGISQDLVRRYAPTLLERLFPALLASTKSS